MELAARGDIDDRDPRNGSGQRRHSQAADTNAVRGATLRRAGAGGRNPRRSAQHRPRRRRGGRGADRAPRGRQDQLHRRRCGRSEEHTSELQSLMRISYAVFCLKKTKKTEQQTKMVEKTKVNTKTNKQINKHTHKITKAKKRK